MEKIKNTASWIASIIVLIVIFIFFIKIFLSELLPLRYAQIPQETIDFFKNIPEYFGFRFRYNPDPDPGDWGKYKNIDSLITIEDSLFIVYYSLKDSAQEYQNALLTLKLAKEAVPELERFMHDYPYPWEVRNRKLPIYLAVNRDMYASICYKLYEKKCSPTSVGTIIYEYSDLGIKVEGIVLSPESYTAFSDDREKSFKITLWHEMNHYVYFANYDFYKNETPYLWFTEGCAEYFAGNESRLKEIDKITSKFYDFSENDKDYSAYWVGYTAFKYFSMTYGLPKTTYLIKKSYSLPLNKALYSAAGISIKDWESDWKKYIERSF